MAFSRTEKRFGTWLRALKCFGLQTPKKRFLGEIALAFLEHGVASVRRNTLCNNARDKSEIGLLLARCLLIVLVSRMYIYTFL